MTPERQHEALAALKEEMNEQITQMVAEIQDMFDHYQVPYKVTITFTFERKETH